MKTGTTDSGIIKMNDKSRLQIRLHYQGFFPKNIGEHIEEVVAEAIHTFLRDSNYRCASMCKSTRMFTEILEMELDELQASFPEKIRYTNIKYHGDMAVDNSKPTADGLDVITGNMKWMMEVHLEEASAPCTYSIDMFRLDPEDGRS